MYVGVILVHDGWLELGSCIPHVRGGDPIAKRSGDTRFTYSPCTWGWSLLTPKQEKENEVFPMYVGVILKKRLADKQDRSIPHVRGGDPWLAVN